MVAFDKKNGRELWRALPSDSEPGYGPPIVISAGGGRQLIVWHPKAVSALDPATGEVLWQQPFRSDKGLSVATPVFSGSRLLVSAFVNGSMMLDLDRQSPAARLLWRGKSDSEIDTDTLHSLISTPVIDGDTLYGVCSYGHLRGLSATTGERLWETLEVTGEKARWATAFLVRHRDRYFISNDRGELIIARLSPSGYREIDRTHLIAPTSRRGIGRRQAGAVNWSHPAYANRHIWPATTGRSCAPHWRGRPRSNVSPTTSRFHGRPDWLPPRPASPRDRAPRCSGPPPRPWPPPSGYRCRPCDR